MAITTQQFNKLATKSDLKKDLKELKQESKSDLKKLRQESKKDIAGVKSDLNRLEEKMDSKFDAAFQIFATKEDLKNLETKEEAKAAKNEILTAIDGITKQYQEFDIGFAMNQGAHDRFEKELLRQKKELELLKRN